jgi:hypothetical protein
MPSYGYSPMLSSKKISVGGKKKMDPRYFGMSGPGPSIRVRYESMAEV